MQKVQCSKCESDLYYHNFSKNQITKGVKRKCKNCVKLMFDEEMKEINLRRIKQHNNWIDQLNWCGECFDRDDCDDCRLIMEDKNNLMAKINIRKE